ncbi:MAG: sensor domain-containing diguanylate cyclase [Sulfuriferula sp.]|nr:sensor domain-containing diguanylate cyclase [Sulfuriferula sp.]
MMPDQKLPGEHPDESALLDEIARLNKIIRALMDRAERSTSVQVSDFGLFQVTVMLEERVRKRTIALETALRDNERITRALRESEIKFHGLANQSLVGILIIEDGKFIYTNPKFNKIFGYTAKEIRHVAPLDTIFESDRPLVAEHMRKHLSGDKKRLGTVFRGLRKNGTVINIEFHASAMNMGGKRVLISLVIDVTERTRAEQEVNALQEMLREQSTHDALTGLYNRHHLEETLDRELIAAQRHGHPISIIMGDLDHFKTINDSYGHLAGDAVLRTFGTLMKQHARSSDIYCRYGGEEFLLVLPQMAKHNAIERAEQLRKTIAATPVDYGTTQIAVTVSFGVATFPHDGGSGDALIAAADQALYAAKATGRNRVNASPATPDTAIPVQIRGADWGYHKN